MAALIGLFVGAVVGKLMLGDWGAALFAIIGFFVGVLIAKRKDRETFRKPEPESAPAPVNAASRPEMLGEPTTPASAAAASPTTLPDRVAALERRVAELERAVGFAVVPAAAVAPLSVGTSAVVEPTPPIETPVGDATRATVAASQPAPDQAPELALAADGTMQPVLREADAATATPAASRVATPPSPPAEPNVVWAWITGGNTLARVGVLVLFVGIAFLLKYAAEHLTIPIEVRLAGVALGGVALLIVGWRLRERRTAYAMILQGGGVAVLYLTVFAALRLYALIPAVAAFALLFWIAALSSWLAIRQDAIALAAIGVLGGFVAPILTSTSAGNHVLLFSYYALLNAGIFFIAWFKAWRPLNLLGFACTFVIGTLWGVTRYEPEFFATTEPFLVLFFLYYVGIAVLYAVRQSVAVRHYVDGTIVFATPLVSAALQHALVRDTRYGMAISAIAASALYLGLGKWLYDRRRDDLRLLVESFLALGAVFLTLAIPFALDARWTSGTWALEGAALVWIGVRQHHRAPRLFGLMLQVAAGLAFAVGAVDDFGPAATALPLLNSNFVGAGLIAFAGLSTAWLYHAHADDVDPLERGLAPFVFAWGVLWWLGAQAREIEDWIARDLRVAIGVKALAANAALFAFVAHRLRWPLARVPSALALPALLVVALVGVVSMRTGSEHLFAHGGAIAWPLALFVTVLLLRHFERALEPAHGAALDWAHAASLWLLALVVTHEIGWAAAELVNRASVWPIAVWGLAPAFGLASVAALSAHSAWPIGVHRRAYLVSGAAPIVAWLVLWSLITSVASDGNPAPLPYVPLINPLDLAQGFVLVALAMWALRLRGEGVDLRDYVSRELRLGIPAVLVFVWVNAIALRTIHHWYGIPYALDPMWRSPLVQATLSLLWTVGALATMVWSNRRAARAGWIAGAVLLAAVVAKLFLVDLSRVGTIERIVSFIGVGVLLLVIGYLAPVPTRKEQA
jgi:uncharacterized membrane protein